MTLSTPDIAALLAAARTERISIAPISGRLPSFDLATGYEVQALHRSAAEPLIGWKLGVTSRAKQAQVGVHEPIRGFLAGEHAMDLGEPLIVSEHINPRAEPEIVFMMGRAVDGAHVTTVDVLRATAGVAVGIEIIDSRYQDYRFTMPDVVADNSSAGRFVVGTPVSPDGIDLRLVGVVFEHRGDVVATASGAATLGHPAAAVAWLVRSLAAEGLGLREGDVILSGGLTAAVAVAPGDVVVATIDRLGSVELACA